MAILSVLDGAGASKWQSGTIYPSGLVVTSGGGIWVSNAYNINETPGSGHSWDSLTTIDTSGTLLASALDTPSAGTLTIGGTTATAITLGRSGITTAVQGVLTAGGTITAPNVGCTAWSVLAGQTQTSDGTANTFDQWTTGWGGGGTNGAMSFASSTITVTNAGTYSVSFSGTAMDTTAVSYVNFQIWSAGAVIAGGTTTLSASNSVQLGFCISTVVTLPAAATLKIYFSSTSASQAISIGNACFAAERLY
jgi:hypothetical protein